MVEILQYADVEEVETFRYDDTRLRNVMFQKVVDTPAEAQADSDER
jgi:hypothetical protein